MTQLALPFVHEPAYDPGQFLEDTSNREALVWTRTEWPALRLALWGPAGCGKTHMLHVWAGSCDSVILSGPRLTPGREPPGNGAIAVDDADEAPDHALLHLLNACAEDSRRVLLAARTAPSRWPTQLPDLASRLRAMLAVEIGPPSDEMLHTLFSSLLEERQLAVPHSLQQWLLLRLPREAAALREAAARLDRAALQAGRRVSHTMAAQVADVVGAGLAP